MRLSERDYKAILAGKPLPLSESAFQTQVIDLAHACGFMVAHFRAARTQSGTRWMTPVQADGAGFPDLVLAKPGRCIFAELKADDGRMSEDQTRWMLALDGQEKYVWRPRDFQLIEGTLRLREVGFICP